MNTQATSPAVALDLPAHATALSADELDRTVGGSPDPVTLGALVFAASVIVGIIDRILFGGCKCRII